MMYICFVFVYICRPRLRHYDKYNTIDTNGGRSKEVLSDGLKIQRPAMMGEGA